MDGVNSIELTVFRMINQNRRLCEKSKFLVALDFSVPQHTPSIHHCLEFVRLASFMRWVELFSLPSKSDFLQLLRKKPLEMTDIRIKAIQGLKTGDTFSVSRTFSRADVAQFADISRDDNPVHSSLSFARAKKFDGCICHGLLVASLLTEIGGQIGWLASGMQFSFKKPVYFGDTITCTFTIINTDENRRATAEAVFTNNDGITVLEAVITGILPGTAEKEIMRGLLAEKPRQG